MSDNRPQHPEGSGDDGSGDDPLSQIFKALFPGGMPPGGLPGGMPGGLPAGLGAIPGMPADPAALQAMLAQVQRLLSTADEGPVNWEAAHDVARQVASEGGDPTPTDAQHRQVTEALRTADLWLDRVCDLPAAAGRTEAWSRAEWVEFTLPTWKGIVEPIATSVGEAVTTAMSGQAPPELRPMLSGALPMMRRMGGAFFGAQLGRALGTLAREVLGAGDVGLPLLTGGRTALLPANVSAFGEGLDLREDEIRLYLALREAAQARLFTAVPWLRGHLLGAVEEYARGITIDMDALEEAVRSIDPTDPQALQDALTSGMFEPRRTPAQQAGLDRLETALALIEGWVDEVVDTAARNSLPHAAALREIMRRRRATGGPAEHVFASLVGLELRPRRLREAAAVWAALTAARGVAGRDALWAHPDLVPTAESFADPTGFAVQPGTSSAGGQDDLDAELEALLSGESPSGGPGGPDGPGSSDGPGPSDGPGGGGGA